MKSLWNQIQVLKAKEVGGKTILQIATSTPLAEILRYQNQGNITGEIKLDDTHRITSDQRKKIFATVKDISLYTGYEAEYLRDLLEYAFCYLNNIESFSLSDCSLEIAREFISYLIELCIEEDIPLGETPLDRTDDINKYLFMTIKKSVCSVCCKPAVIYSVKDKKICFCNEHYDMAKMKGLSKMESLYKIYPIKLRE